MTMVKLFGDMNHVGLQCRRSNQEIAASEMGCNGQFVLRKFQAAHIRFWG
jgi:hypothetical protein